MNKIFGIGLPKTGQSSLATAVWMLGYKTIQYPYTLSAIRKNDCALDLPVTIRYKELDKKFPGSKFIMTVRDYDTWIESFRNHYRRHPASRRHKSILKFRERFWGITRFNRKIMTKKYYWHAKSVKKYFEGRESDLLIINIIDGEGWKKLCPFLGRKIPRKKFPIENVGKYRK